MKKFPSSESLEKRISKYLFLYRLTLHSTTGVPPAQHLLGRILQSQFDLIKPDLADKVCQKQEKQKLYHDSHAKRRKFQVSDAVFVRDFPSGKTWLPGTVIAIKGPLSHHVELTDGRVFCRHVDRIRVHTSNIETNEPRSDNDVEIPTPNTDNDSTDTPDNTLNKSESLETIRCSIRNRDPPDYLRY